MEETQSFRLVDTIDTLKITLHHVEGQDVVCWEDIEQVFPGVKRARNGNSVISFIRHSNPQSPSSALEVVLTTTPKSAHSLKVDLSDGKNDLRTDAATDVPADDRVSANDKVLDALEVAQPVKATLFRQTATQVSSKARASEVEQRFISLLAPKHQETVRTSPEMYQASGKAINHVHCENSRGELSAELNGPFLLKMETLLEAKNTELYEAMNAKLEELQATIVYNDAVIIAKQEDIKQLQQKVLDIQARLEQLQQRTLEQLTVLQPRVQAVLTQTYELHEYPIPRLFVVLPQDPFGWDAVNPFANKFRLYFLCECGEHTKSINSKTEVSHRIHLAKHEGYEIAQPLEFFQQYGTYVLTILKMIKYKITVPGVLMPAFSQLINPDVLGQSTVGLKLQQDTIVPGADQVIGMMDRISEDNIEVIERSTGQVENKAVLDGADLRKLETFLKARDGKKVCGNLCKTVTDDGHVKWVCMDHYREKFNKTAVEAFRRKVDSLGGSFDENNSLVKVKLGSTASAKQFYSALGRSRFVHELDIILNWDCTETDLQALEDALRTSAVAALHLDVEQFRPSLSSILFSLPARYEALYRIMDPPNIKSVHIVLPRSLIKLSNFTPKKTPRLRTLSFEMRVGPARIHARMFDTGSTVITLYLPLLAPDGAQALSEALETSSTLTTLDLTNNAIGDSGAQALSEALKTNLTLTNLHLDNTAIEESGAQALSEALKTNSTLTTLQLNNNAIGPYGAKALSETLETNFTLTTLGLGGNSIEIGASPLSHALSVNSTLTTLELSENRIENYEAYLLSKALKCNRTLTTLNLGQNLIKFRGAQYLSEALKTNSTLTTLYLHFNAIGSSGAQALSEALKTNSTLNTLHMGRNAIGDIGAQALSEALKTNSTLTTLNLEGNSIGDSGAQALSEALKTNSTLTTLSLHDNSHKGSLAQAISDALKNNSTRKVRG